jgi:ADP-ribose pyrophosphatase YjhB (NUDIX family)
MPRIKKTNSAGGIVLNSIGEVLVVNQNRNSWSLPKGHIDKGEDAIVAAVREIYEESGVKDLEFIKDLGKYERFKIGLNGKDDHSELKTIHMFLFRTKQMELKPIDKENPEARWVKRNEVSKLLTHPKDREFFKKCLRNL